MRIARGLSEIFPKTFWSLFFWTHCSVRCPWNCQTLSCSLFSYAQIRKNVPAWPVNSLTQKHIDSVFGSFKSSLHLRDILGVSISYIYNHRTLICDPDAGTRSFAIIFTALHCMQGGLSYERLSVCLSVCPSVCQTRELWQNESTWRKKFNYD